MKHAFFLHWLAFLQCTSQSATVLQPTHLPDPLQTLPPSVHGEPSGEGVCMGLPSTHVSSVHSFVSSAEQPPLALLAAPAPVPETLLELEASAPP